MAQERVPCRLLDLLELPTWDRPRQKGRVRAPTCSSHWLEVPSVRRSAVCWGSEAEDERRQLRR